MASAFFVIPFAAALSPQFHLRIRTRRFRFRIRSAFLDVPFYPLRFFLPDRKFFRLHAGSVGLADSRSRFVEDLEALGRQAEQPFRHFAGAVICFQRAVQAADLLLRQGVKNKIVPFVF